MERKIAWNKRPALRLAKELRRISEESDLQAERVETAILKKLEKSRVNPEINPPDKYKTDNPGYFRAFETHNYRVTYRFTEKEIRVLRIRHVRQEPRMY